MLDTETSQWVENRLCGIGSYLRKRNISHKDRRELGLALTRFTDLAGINRPRVYSRFWDNDKSLVKQRGH